MGSEYGSVSNAFVNPSTLNAKEKDRHAFHQLMPKTLSQNPEKSTLRDRGIDSGENVLRRLQASSLHFGISVNTIPVILTNIFGVPVFRQASVNFQKKPFAFLSIIFHNIVECNFIFPLITSNFGKTIAFNRVKIPAAGTRQARVWYIPCQP